MLTGEETEKLLARVSDLLEEDPEFSASLADEDVASAMLRPGIGFVELMRVVFDGYADRPALGQRASELVSIGGRSSRVLVPRYDTVTYAELWRRVTALASALAGDPVQQGDRVATMGFASVEHVVVDLSAQRLGAVSVPLHAGSPMSRLLPMVEESEPSVIACSTEHLESAVELSMSVSSVKTLLVFDHHADIDDDRDALTAAEEKLATAGARVVVHTLGEALEKGGTRAEPTDPEPDLERLAAIIYTSGSSGSPKGAMHPERLVAGAWLHITSTLVNRGFALPAITLHYLPLSHTGGRAMLYSVLGGGGTAYFVGRSDLSTMLDDLASVRPTQLNFVPRVWEMLYSEFMTRLRQVDADRDGAVEHEILTDMRMNLLGGRYVTALTGSAPISADLAAWVERLLDSHLMDALGATESGSVVVDGEVQRPPVTDYKLVDVPELGYFSTDRPHPRGELLIKSTTMFRGYYRRDDLTAGVFDEEGFYRTGDVVAEIAPDRLRYVDRRNNVLKLSNGEFVTVSKLEAVFGDCAPVAQLYVYGNSERSYLLAVVVPTEEALAEHGREDVKDVILRSMREAATYAGLESYEVPRDIIVETSPFTVENGLLTSIRKPSHANLKLRYQQQLEALYAQHAKAEDDRWRMLSASAAERPAIETVCGVAGAVLGLASGDPTPDSHFADLGGDSLSAVTYTSALSDMFGVGVPVGVVISPANDLAAIADHIDAARRLDSVGPTFASVHGAGATEVLASDLTLDRFIDAATLDGAESLAAPVAEPRRVLLTGATGYLGRFLLLDSLERMAEVGGTVTCLVRARDDTAARTRLDDVFDSGDDELVTRYRRLSADHLEVLASDKSQPFLGLEKDVWGQLAEEVDLIIDPAALVNHMLSYPNLFDANVVGTAEVIRLALTVRKKCIAHVSSVAVGMTVPPGEFTEAADVRTVSPSRPVDDTYASGYATSKWAGEVLLREAHDLCGLPVSVFRCGMIMAETRYRGQLNLPDMVTRLIFSLAVSGLAPESFYASATDGGRTRAHFDGLPVDFVADSVSTLSRGQTSGFQTFHVVNPHDDGIGLDEFVDWMRDAGCSIERIADYDEWYRRIGSALKNLPDVKRQASLLPIVESYRYQQPALAGAFAPTDRFRAAVEEHGIGADGDVPHINSTIILKYVTDLEVLGLLDDRHRIAEGSEAS